MAISVYKAGQTTGRFVRDLHEAVLQNVRNGGACKTITRWQLPAKEAHAGQVYSLREKGPKDVRTIETAFASSQSNSKFKHYLRETISEDRFTREQIADVMYASEDGIIQRVMGHPEDPIIVQFVKSILGTNPEGKSMVLTIW